MATNTETINLTVTNVCKRTVEGDRLQEIFKIDDTLTVSKEKQPIDRERNATVFKITVHDKEYALKQFNENINTEFVNFCIVQSPKTYCLVTDGSLNGIITEFDFYEASLTPIPPTRSTSHLVPAQPSPTPRSTLHGPLPPPPVPTPRIHSSHIGGARKSKSKKNKKKTINKTRTMKRKKRTMKKAKKIVKRKKNKIL